MVSYHEKAQLKWKCMQDQEVSWGQLNYSYSVLFVMGDLYKIQVELD
jgi:hypothetical protein